MRDSLTFGKTKKFLGPNSATDLDEFSVCIFIYYTI